MLFEFRAVGTVWVRQVVNLDLRHHRGKVLHFMEVAMEDWQHSIGREEYELLIDQLLRASVIASAIESMADDLDPATLKEMAKTMRERIVGCLVLGRFNEDDVESINQDVRASMFTQPDA